MTVAGRLYDGAHAYPIRSTVLKTALGLSKKMNIYFVRKDRADDVKPHKLMNYGKGQAGSGRCLCEQGWWCRLLYKDGVNYVRSLSKSGYKSNTPLQAGVKARFKSASQMAGQMKEIAKVGFPQRKRGLTPKNAWHSANKDCFRKRMKVLRSILKNSNFQTAISIRRR